MNNLFQKINQALIYLLLIIFPFFFLPLTVEFSLTNKFYLFIIFTLILLIFQLMGLVFGKKISLNEKTFDLSISLFLIAVLASMFLSKSNKIQTLTEVNFGTGIFIIGTIYYFIISRQKNLKIENVFSLNKLISLFLSLITIVLYFKPFEKINLPESLAFLKAPYFTPLGNYLNLIFILGLFLLINLITFSKKDTKSLIFNSMLIVINLIALGLTIYSTIKNKLIVLPPFSFSWFAVLETFKNLKTAFFGFGIGNFINVFPFVKNVFYNQSSLWTIFSFNYASSVLFQIIVETGLLGLFAFGLIIYLLIRRLSEIKNFKTTLIISYLLVFIIFIPPSLITWFYFFTFLSLIAIEKRHQLEFNFERIPSFILIVITILIILTTSVIYLTVNNYQGEIYFKKALEETSKNNVANAYQNLKKARTINPFEEKYIINFSQLNLNYALSYLNYLINEKKVEQISEEDRQKILQSVQTSIAEGKELIRLNPNRADYYQFLARIYKNLINIANEAYLWSISLFQRAINLDPNNPVYRLELGGLYYLLQKFPDAINLFQQAVLLKPDWANGYYNLAWGYYQNKEYDKATQAMENVLKLIDKTTQLTDWNKANQELEQFKKMFAEENKQATGTTNLNLPEKPSAELEPKINLPEKPE